MNQDPVGELFEIEGDVDAELSASEASEAGTTPKLRQKRRTRMR